MSSLTFEEEPFRLAEMISKTNKMKANKNVSPNNKICIFMKSMEKDYI
jgi:hypothetical protein